jgi:hypothetical protein
VGWGGASNIPAEGGFRRGGLPPLALRNVA